MSLAQSPSELLSPEPLPKNLRSVQPGGGRCYAIELAWGRWRRWYLRRFWPKYVQRMAALRTGDPSGAPHDLLDPRDLKYCRNQCTCDWPPEHDLFQWRERVPFARWGLAELQLLGYPLALLTLLAWAYSPLLAIGPGIVLVLVVYFFRDPPRRVPTEPGLWVAPCDGTVAEVTEVPHHPFLGGPAVRIGIFLSIFNVHINRMSAAGRVIRLEYSPGQFLNALNPESALKNENLSIGFQEPAAPYRRFVVRQIAGLIARRIVCNLRPGEVAPRGHKFGMIKLGSRTELVIPAEPGLEVLCRLGDRVKGGSTVVCRYRGEPS